MNLFKRMFARKPLRVREPMLRRDRIKRAFPGWGTAIDSLTDEEVVECENHLEKVLDILIRKAWGPEGMP